MMAADVVFSRNTTILDLPEPVAVKIFSFIGEGRIYELFRLKLVCKTWYRIAEDPSLWRKLRFPNCEKLDAIVLDRVLSWCGLVKEVDLSDCPLVDDQCLDCITTKCPHLQVLNINNCACVYTSSGLKAVGSGCPQIRSLTVSVKNTNYSDGSTEDSAVYLIRNLKNLRQVKISCGEQDENDSFFVISFDLLQALHNNPKLRSFHCVGGIMPEETVILSSWNFNLRELYIPSCDNLNDKVLTCIARSCPYLQALDVSECYGIYDTGIVEVSEICSELTHLNVGSCAGVTDIAIQAVAQNCIHLQDLCVAGNTLHKPPSGNITDVAITSIARSCPDLRRLNVKWCQGVSDAGIATLASSCTRLSHINAGGCLAISDVSMKVVATFCKDLQSLEIVECLRITRIGLNDILQNCKNLEHLDMQVCSYVTDLTFDSAGAAMRHIDLSYCTKLTDASLSQIACHCPKLKYLSVAGCYRITDAGLKTLVRGCHCLEYLDVSFRGLQSNFHVTDDSLIALALNCPHICNLDLVGCWNISQECIELTVKSCRFLKQLNFSQITSDSELCKKISGHLLKLRSSCSYKQVTSPPRGGKQIQSFLFKLSAPIL